MKLEDFTVRKGATLPLTLTETDLSAETASITVRTNKDAVSAAFSKTASFTGDSERTADLTLSSIDTAGIPVGNYVYQLTIEYSDGAVVKLPEPSHCEEEDDSCAFPSLIICEALDPGVS